MTVSQQYFNFLGLPSVLQTEVARYLPKEDLADKTCVSKAAKTVFENNQVWAEIAKKSNVRISNPKNVKKDLVAYLAEDIRKANRYLFEGGHKEELMGYIGSVEIDRLSNISDPHKQREELIQHLRNFDFHGDVTLFNLLKIQTFQRHELEALKTLLKLGVDFFKTLPLKSERAFFWIGENIDEGVFKAYIAGMNSLSRRLTNAIDKAFTNKSPKFLKLLLQVDSINSSNLDYAISCVIQAKGRDQATLFEMWNLILDKYSAFPDIQQQFQSELEKRVKNTEFST